MLKVNSDNSVFKVCFLFKMNSEYTNKFRENNVELAKALVEHKKTIDDLKTDLSKYQFAHLDTYLENQILKKQLNFAKKTVFDLIKANTQNYTDVMRTLGITTTINNNNLSSKLISSNASLKTVPIQCHSLEREKEPIGPKKFASQVPTEKKDNIRPDEQNPTSSTVWPTCVKQKLPQSEQVCFNMFSSRFSLLKFSGFLKRWSDL